MLKANSQSGPPHWLRFTGWPAETSMIRTLSSAESGAISWDFGILGGCDLTSLAANSDGVAITFWLRNDCTRESLAPCALRMASSWGVRARASLRWLTSVTID